MAKIQLTPFEDCIKAFLDQLAEEDELFAKTYQKPNKSIKGCCEFIYKQVQKNRKGNSNCVGVSDDEVYGLAIHYYDEDGIEDSKEEVPVTVEVQHVPEAKPEKKPRKPRKKKDDDVPEEITIELC